MKLQHMKRRVQRGFTLVELAIVLVIAGLILVAVLRGTDAIQKAQVERMVSDLRGLQGILLEFQKRNGRLPGDCDNNGVAVADDANVQFTSTLLPRFTQVAGNASNLDFDPENRQMVPPPQDDIAEARVVCTDSEAEREASINLVWNELRRAGVVDANRLPRELARHSMGDVFAVTTMQDTDTLGNQPAGVIVVYGIPIWMAEAVDASIDGTATLYGVDTGTAGPANIGRVRLWNGTGASPTPMTVESDRFVFTAEAANRTYDQGETAADRDRLISISFQYTPNKLIR